MGWRQRALELLHQGAVPCACSTGLCTPSAPASQVQTPGSNLHPTTARLLAGMQYVRDELDLTPTLGRLDMLAPAAGLALDPNDLAKGPNPAKAPVSLDDVSAGGVVSVPAFWRWYAECRMGASQAGCLVVLLPPPHTAKACRASPLTLSAPPLPRRSSTWWWCGTAPSPSCCRTSTLAPSSWAGASTWTASTCLASWGEGPQQPCSEAGEAQKLWRGQAAGDQPPLRTEARLPPWGCTIGPLPNCRCFMATYFFLPETCYPPGHFFLRTFHIAVCYHHHLFVWYTWLPW